ncbi:putative defensin-like protein [Cardamine amara subsp. amara]|uniref:Defensin-like protein n=1 Tax=Cardamine amara subsp. amara TaxID=228776 RepID=A0ABD1AVC3_CARAN
MYCSSSGSVGAIVYLLELSPKQMASKAISLLLISLILTCMRSVSIPKAEAKYHSCKTVDDCQDVHCLVSLAKCIDSQCQCPPISPPSVRKILNSKPAETSLPCKTASDCEDKLTCVFGKFICKNLQCQCLDG